MRQISVKDFLSNFGGMNVRTQLHSVAVERGTTWQKAMDLWQANSGENDGFYLSAQVSAWNWPHLKQQSISIWFIEI